MNATELAVYESGIATRQTLRRGKRTIYVRFYDVPLGSSPPLPEAGDFLPGETSGACVTADGVTILPVASNEFTGLRVAVTAQQPMYQDLSASGAFPLGEYFVGNTLGTVVTGERSESSVGDSQYNRWRFEVPAATWSTLTPPSKGDATPSQLGGGGYVLSKEVDLGSVPGFAVCELVCGWRWVTFDSLTKVSSRSVTVHKKLKVALNGTTALSGPVSGEAETQRYVVSGEDEADETYVQINIESIVSSIPTGWQGSNFGKRNQAAVTIRGVTMATGTVLYVGGASEDVAASQSPTGVAALRMSLTLLAGKVAWPLTIDRYIETKKVVQVVVVDVDGAEVGKSRVSQWVRAAAATDSPTIRAEFDMATAIAALP